MLRKLSIENFILIEKLDLEFSKGFCVITGQTGAGKSILLDSILFCLGEKIFGQPIKAGCDFCKVTIVFEGDDLSNNYLTQNNIPALQEVEISCQQFANNRKKFFINGQNISAKIAQELLPILLELHSQHHHTALLDKSQHIVILDDYINAEFLKQELAKTYNIWQNLEKKQREYQAHQAEIKQDIDYLEHICQELEQAAIQDGEERKLVEMKRKLQSSDKEKELLKSVVSQLDNLPIEKILFSFQKGMGTFEPSPEYEQISNQLDAVYDSTEDIKSLLNEAIDKIESPEYSLEEVEDRLHQIRHLARKHHLSSDELIGFLAKSQHKLESLHAQIQDAHEGEKQIIQAKNSYYDYAKELSQKRQNGAKKLAEKVMNELKFLDMKKAVFEVNVNQKEEYCGLGGIDQVEFLAATNPGSKMNAIDKVASGGELARFMLALRVSLFNNAPKKTIIFDEVDVGISGSVADSVGIRIKDLSKTVQVIVITHQPQVAGKADQHILVEKIQGINDTISQVKLLDNDGRNLEIARMISGKKITSAGVKAAEELLK